ncbi:hypothetical protein BFG60_4750 [Microcystis aeruginosa NIES-98]|nr:hypothetical protein BFG60_4750 [Microcystis aeruginosa NIES-98]
MKWCNNWQLELSIESVQYLPSDKNLLLTVIGTAVGGKTY